jgi:probable F420-dependent oxidoreductase
MKLGAIFPQNEIGTDPAAIRDYAQGIEEAGFDHLVVYDHVLGAVPERFVGAQIGFQQPPYTDQSPFHEVFVLFGFLAAATRRLELATGVLVLPQRQTALVAKQAAAVDLLSGGRLRLGVGVGWNFVEYEALNEDYRSRGQRVDEQIALMRKLWTEPVVSFEGRWHHVEGAGINPLPVQRPIPIWIGGAAERVLRRTAELADGWFPPGDANPPAALEGAFERLRGYLSEAGRDPAGLAVEGRMRLSIGGEREWAARAAEWRALGATHLSVNTMNAGLESPRQHLEAVLRWKEAVAGG